MTIPVEVRVQSMVCELLEDTKARLEDVLVFLEDQLKEERASLEESKQSQYGNPAMYQKFINGNLEHMAEVKRGIAQLEALLIQAKELHQNITGFWKQYDKAREERLGRRSNE